MSFRHFAHLTPVKVITTSVVLVLALSLGVVYAADSHDTATYRVTIVNLSHGQPLSPPVAATHGRRISMFNLRRQASPELEALAEDGDQIPLYDLLGGLPKVTEAVDVAMPLMPYGQVFGDFTDTVTFDISAKPGDRLSLATMLICSNDGFTGLSSVRLPWRVQRVYTLRGYDAGTENNTQMSQDIVDPCSALGPVSLEGDPNGNENIAVNTDPAHRITLHRGVVNEGDLSVNDHGWLGPVGVVIVKRID